MGETVEDVVRIGTQVWPNCRWARLGVCGKSRERYAKECGTTKHNYVGRQRDKVGRDCWGDGECVEGA